MLSSSNQNDAYDNPFASSSDREPLYVEPDLDLTGQSTSRAAKPSNENPFANVSGNIGSSTRPTQSTQPAQSFSYTGEDTLDEPVTTTIVSTRGYMRAWHTTYTWDMDIL